MGEVGHPSRSPARRAPTTLGCEGIAVKPGEHLAIADDPQDFAREVVRLLDDPKAATAMGARGRAPPSDSTADESDQSFPKSWISRPADPSARPPPRWRSSVSNQSSSPICERPRSSSRAQVAWVTISAAPALIRLD